MNTFYIISLLYLLITSPLLRAISPPTCESCITRIYHETESRLEPYRAFLIGNEMVTQMIKFSDEFNETDLCIEPRVILRWIHENGFSEGNIVDFPFPAYNFCPGPNGKYPLEIHRIVSDKLLIMYVNATNIADTPSHYGLIVNKSGKIIRFVM